MTMKEECGVSGRCHSLDPKDDTFTQRSRSHVLGDSARNLPYLWIYYKFQELTNSLHYASL